MEKSGCWFLVSSGAKRHGAKGAHSWFQVAQSTRCLAGDTWRQRRSFQVSRSEFGTGLVFVGV